MGNKKVNFRIIPEGEEPYGVLFKAMKFHDDLRECKVALAWRLRTKEDVDGHIVLGKCVKTSDLQKEFHPFDFIIVLNEEFWLQFEEKQKLALMDHELCHAAPQIDEESGEQVHDERGRKCWRIRKHDIEEFTGVVSRHGCYKADLERFAEVLRKKQSNPLFDAATKANSATININLDAKCSRCGDKGAMPSGICLKCATDDIIAKGKTGNGKSAIQ
jgi:hypothetical protein